MKLESDLRNNLGNLPKTLEDMYQRIYEDISSETGSGPQCAIMGLRWVMVSRRPLTPSEWLFATAHSLRSQDNLPLSSMLDWCHNLVTEDKESNVIRFAHLSVQEFLGIKDDFNISKAHSMAAQACLSILIDAANSTPQKSEVLAEYAAIYWAHHLNRSDDQYMQGYTLALIRMFLGTPDKPAEPYAKWTEARSKKYDYNLYWYLDSQPPNPLFAVSFFRFGELYGKLWDWGSVDVNCKTLRGNPPIMLAIEEGHDMMVRMLLDCGAEINCSGCGDYNPLIAAIKRYRVQVVTMLLDRNADIRANGCQYTDVLIAAATNGDVAVVNAIIDRDPNIKITNTVFNAAAKNREHGLKIFGLLLDRAKSFEVTQEMIIQAAAGIYKDLLQLLLERDPGFEITAETVLGAIKYGGRPEQVELLLERYPGGITKDIIIAAACHYKARELLELVLPRYPDDKMTNDILLPVVKEDAYKLEVLLEKFPNTKITQSVLLAVLIYLRNPWTTGTEILERVLKNTATGEITEAVLIAAGGVWRGAKESMKLLLDRRHETKITESILISAAANSESRGLIKLFLARDPDIPICESILASAVTAGKCEDTVMLLLQTAPDIRISESTLAGVVRMGGLKTMELLLEKMPSIKICESILVAAAEWGCVKTMEQLLSKDPSIKITPPVLEAAARCRFSKNVMQLLLSRGNKLKIPDEAMVFALSNPAEGEEVVDLLLLEDPGIEITKSMLVAAAEFDEKPQDYNFGSGVRKMKRLLASNVSLNIITSERVLVAAAANESAAPELLRLLLCKAESIRAELRAKRAVHTHGNLHATQSHLSKGSTFRISEPVVMAAVWNENYANDIMKLLLSKDWRIEITARVVECARKNKRYGKDVMELLLSEANKFTDEAVEMAAYGYMGGAR